MPANPFSDSLAVRVSGDSSGAQNALGGLQNSILSTRKMALGLGGVLAGALAAKGIGSAISAAGDFNSKMNESLAIMGDVSQTLRNDMAQAARDVATSTTFSAEQAAESYFFLASAGLDAAESIEAMPEVAEFAQAGMFDMAQATDLLTDSASALGLETSEYNELADQLVKANTLANASVEQFATALKTRAAAEMRNANIELEEGVSALAAFADQGIKGRRAGQVFQRTLLTLQEASRENSEALEELGFQVFNADGSMRSLSAITKDLTEATADMSVEERNAALESLGFTRRTREGIVALLGKSEQLKDYQSELSSAGGTTEEVADKQLQSFNSQIQLLSSNLNDIKIAIGNELLPVVNDFVGGLNSLLSGAKDLNETFGPDTAEDIRGITSAFDDLTGPVSDNAEEILDLSTKLFVLGQGVLPHVAPALRDIRFILEGTAAALDTVNESLDKSIELWNKLPPSIREAAVEGATIAVTAPMGGPSTLRGLRAARRGFEQSDRPLSAQVAGDVTGQPTNRSGEQIVVTVEGDTDVVRNVSAEVVDDRMMVNGRRVFRATGTR